jgi:hypothetical protein
LHGSLFEQENTLTTKQNRSGERTGLYFIARIVLLLAGSKACLTFVSKHDGAALTSAMDAA